MDTLGQIAVAVFTTVVGGILTAIVLRRIGLGKNEHGAGSPSDTDPNRVNGNPSHGSDSSWWEKFQPTPEVIAIRARYKDKIWSEKNVTRIRELLREYWHAEQVAWGENTWNNAAEAAFHRASSRVTNPTMAIRVIENVQACKY